MARGRKLKGEVTNVSSDGPSLRRVTVRLADGSETAFTTDETYSVGDVISLPEEVR